MNIKILFSIIVTLSILSGCASFHEIYKPLYQAKPIKESIKGDN